MGARVTVKRLTGSIGAEVNGVILNESLDDATFTAIHQAFLDHNMLVFRRQRLDPAAQTAFANRWGEAFHAPYLKSLEIQDHPEVLAQNNSRSTSSFDSGRPSAAGCRRRYDVCQPVHSVRSIV
jgi:alpha-ketoglutarate-dependent taurine dioxygenase